MLRFLEYESFLNIYSDLALCPNLENPANGAVMMNGVSPEDTANYSCDTGFDLVGAATLTCRDGGMWSPDPPVCRREFKFPMFCRYHHEDKINKK